PVELADLSGGLLPTDPGHVDVHQDRIVGIGFGQVYGFVPVVRDIAAYLLFVEHFFGDDLVDLVVLHHQQVQSLELNVPGVQFETGFLRAGIVAFKVQFKEEGASVAQFTLKVDAAAKEAEQALDDGEAQSGSAVFAVDLYGTLLKTVKNMFLLVVGYPDPIVPDLEVQFYVVLSLTEQFGDHLDLSVLGELQAVAHQVHKDLGEFYGVPEHVLWDVRVVVQDEFGPVSIGRGLKGLHHFGEQFVQFELNVEGLQFIGIDLVDLQDVVDEVQQVFPGELQGF